MRLDGQDIHFLDRRWFRRQIGIVHKNPEFFFTSVAENIAYGREGCSTEEVEQAAKNAGADGFIKALPHVSFFLFICFDLFLCLVLYFYSFSYASVNYFKEYLSLTFFFFQGYETILDESGSPLTAYQKHLLALARALIRKPRILLWEEDLSFMDGAAFDVLIGYLDKVDLVRMSVHVYLFAFAFGSNFNTSFRSSSFRMRIKPHVLKMTF